MIYFVEFKYICKDKEFSDLIVDIKRYNVLLFWYYCIIYLMLIFVLKRLYNVFIVIMVIFCMVVF